MRRAVGNRKQQQGVVLLVLILMLFTVSTTLFLSSVNTHGVEIRRHNDLRTEMQKAKQALLSYAINYPSFDLDYVDDTVIMDEGPGRMLCPDVDNNGLADSNSTDCTDNVRGRLPRIFSYDSDNSKITINDTFANIDQQFWYVVSPAFKEIATTEVNLETTGTLSIDGVSGYAAVIIAPGEALAGQDRSGSPLSAGNYLEKDNVSGSNFFNSDPDPDPDAPEAFNDQVIGIKTSEMITLLSNLTDDVNTSIPLLNDTILESFYDYYIANSALPPNMNNLLADKKNNGRGWLWDEGYMDNAIDDRVDDGSYLLNGLPYSRYTLDGCNTRYYYYLPTIFPNSLYPIGPDC